ncbi:MAG: bacillithiol biosynthesis cysteine-adding enzyme BshC [Tenacibaculum sp.]|nr:bacillithiol biosynthesis cysteine-adding enzyme BshC [Tenacibaculum sp.]
MIDNDCVTQIPFKKTGYFSEIILDYLQESPKLSDFYDRFPNFEDFESQIKTKELSFKKEQRLVLHSVIKNQYHNVQKSEKTQQNINLLLDENSFTVTTGHQLNLFTGPLYFIYKIISTINLCEELSTKFPDKNFVPIYWMATEDHDFDEINFFNFKGRKVHWNSDEIGGVGNFSTGGLEEVFNVFSSCLNTSKNADELRNLFKNAYLKHNNLSDATRYLANELFGEYGLVIIDANNKDLKREFTPFIKKELLEQVSFNKVSNTILKLEKDYKIQVNPREINLFYLIDGLRERIILEKGKYKVNNTDITWTTDEILKEVDDFPERFSPNVIMRPLYQELILPNLCYIGGGGELAYWFELKDNFDELNIPFPILLLRNSALIVSKKQLNKLKSLNISLEEIFLKQNDLLNKKATEKSTIKIDFSEQELFLQKQFSKLKEIAEKTDKSFIGAVKAQEKKQLKGLENLKKRWLRAEKRNNKDLMDRISSIQNELFPSYSLEERQRNFSEFYLEYGSSFIKTLKDNLHPLQLEFTVIVM